MPQKKEKKSSVNPKDRVANRKVDMLQVPPIAMAHEAMAFSNGEAKYGPRNWRGAEVSANVYLSACLRHLYSWAEGEEVAEDSGVHHLGHARACLAILLDAQATGNLHDDRFIGEYTNVLNTLNNNLANS